MRASFVLLFLLIFVFGSYPLSSESFRGMEDENTVRVKVVNGSDAIVSYSVKEYVAVKCGFWKSVEIAEFANRMNETIVIKLFSAEVSDELNLRVIGGEVLVLDPGEVNSYSIGLISKKNHSNSGYVSFSFLVEWSDGVAKISTRSSPTWFEVSGCGKNP